MSKNRWSVANTPATPTSSQRRTCPASSGMPATCDPITPQSSMASTIGERRTGRTTANSHSIHRVYTASPYRLHVLALPCSRFLPRLGT